MDIRLGSRVICRDGAGIGTVDRLVLDPDSHTLVAFIVHRGFLLRHDRIVAQAQVLQVADDGSIHLAASAREADAFPVFFEHEFVTPTSQDLERLPYPISGGASGSGASMPPIVWGTRYSGATANSATRGLFQLAAIHPDAIEVRSNLPRETVTVDRGTAVVDANGKKLGVVEDVIYEADGEMRAVVARTGHIHHDWMHIPITSIAGIAHDHMRLNVTRAEIAPAVTGR